MRGESKLCKLGDGRQRFWCVEAHQSGWSSEGGNLVEVLEVDDLVDLV